MDSDIPEEDEYYFGNYTGVRPDDDFRSNSIFSFMSQTSPQDWPNQGPEEPIPLEVAPSKEESPIEQDVLHFDVVRGPIAYQVRSDRHFLCFKDAVSVFLALQVGRLLGAMYPDAVHWPLYLSFGPFIFFHLFSREAHIILSALWFINVMMTNIQSGATNLRRNIVSGCVIFIGLYILLTFFMSKTMTLGDDSFIPFRSLSRSIDWYEELTCLISLVLLSWSLIRLQKFVQKYAQSFLEQETKANRLQDDNANLAIQLKSYKKDIDLDLDSPVTKVIRTLHQLQDQIPQDLEMQDALDDAICILSSNQLFMPTIHKEAVDADINVWLNTMLNNRQGQKKAESEDAISPLAAMLSMPTLIEPLPVFDTDNPELDIDSWDFDVFQFASASNGHPMMFLAERIFDAHNLRSQFQIDDDVFKNFFRKIEGLYRNNPYHNVLHGCDVMQTAHFFLRRMGLEDLISCEERLACLVAAACHDVDHPGYNNAFLISTASPLALRYNDTAVLENYHCAKTFEILLNDEECNLFRFLSDDKFQRVRSVMLSTILATDMSMHFEYITRFKNKINGTGVNPEDSKDRQLIMDMMVKSSDISNPAKNGTIARKWTDRVMEEFFSQGDEERRRGLPISMFMNRETANVPKCQIGFIDFIVKPLYEPWALFLNRDNEFKGLGNIAANREHYRKFVIEPTKAS